MVQASMKNKSYKVTVSIRHIFISLRCTLFYMWNVICVCCFLKHYEINKKTLCPIAIVIKDDRNRDTRVNAGSCDITLLHPRATLYIARHFLEMVMLYLRPAVSVLWESLSVITLQRHYCMEVQSLWHYSKLMSKNGDTLKLMKLYKQICTCVIGH